jgi:hypothetical protein
MIIEDENSTDVFCMVAPIDPDLGEPPRCCGSVCGHWRWQKVKNEAFVPVHPMLAVSPVHPADEISPWKESDTHGYCGLAGKP